MNNKDSFFLEIQFIASLLEIIRLFLVNKMSSPWEIPSLSISITAMMWLCIAAISTSINLLNRDLGHFAPLNIMQVYYRDITISNIDLFYKFKAKVIQACITLRIELWLYFILTIQHVLTLLVFSLILIFHSISINQRFNVISILSAMSCSSLDVLKGSFIFRKLTQDAKLIIEPKYQKSRSFIEYNI